jgi:neutral ceramidase
MSKLLAGVARRVITPRKGIYLVGYEDRSGGASSIHDDLYATALAFYDGKTMAVIIAVDILCLHEDIVNLIKSRIEKSTAVPKDKILICCSHTHSGPVGYAPDKINLADKIQHLLYRLLMFPAGLRQPRGIAFNRQYLYDLADRCAEAAEEAVAGQRQVALEGGIGEVQEAVNRRELTEKGETVIGVNEAGPVDRAVRVLRIVEGGRTLAVVVNHACHAVTLGPNNYAVSSDWVGTMRSIVEKNTGGLCLFIQGACGNINPRTELWTENNFPDLERIGSLVGNEVLQILKRMKPLREAPIASLRHVLAAELNTPDELKNLPIRNIYRTMLHRITGYPNFIIEPFLALRYPWNSVINKTNGRYTTPLELNALRVGDTVIAAVSVEPFAETGLAVTGSSRAPMTMFAGYTNGMTAYLPTAEEHVRGGYEVNLVPYVYRLPGVFTADTEGRVVKKLNEMVNTLYS